MYKSYTNNTYERKETDNTVGGKHELNRFGVVP